MTVSVTEAAAGPRVEHEERVETGRPGELLPARYGGARAFGWWGMVWLIATEATLFALLIASYFYLRFRFGPPWPPDGIGNPPLTLPLVMTVVLWASSPCVHLAERGIRAGSQRRLRVGLVAGWVLGAAFLVLTFAVEWPTTLEEFGPTTNAYGSMFFTITGFHAAHVVVGLLISGWVQVWAWRGLYDRDRHLSVENFAMYWQFVDAVWAFVLLTVYLSPRF